PGEEFATCLPDLFALFDVGHVDVDADDVVHRPPRCLDEVLDLGEGLPGLAVHRAVTEYPALAVADGHAGDEELVAVDSAVRPGSGRGLLQMRAPPALHLHGVPPLTVRQGSRALPSPASPGRSGSARVPR